MKKQIKDKIMNKTTMLILFAFMLTSTITYGADIKLEQLKPEEMSYSQRQMYQQQQAQGAVQGTYNFEKDPIYYPNAMVKTAIAKYKKGNYTGCIQEMYSILKKDPSNAVAHYYAALCYTQLGDSANAVQSYEKVIALNPNKVLLDYATKGKDCLTGGPTCEPDQEQDELDTFISSPYGNGLSPELSIEMKQKQLERVKQTINTKEELNRKDIEKIRKIDSNKSEAKQTEKLASAEPTSDEVLAAIDVLKRAGVNVSLQNVSSQNENYYMNMMNPMATYSDPQMAEMSMLLGNNNNNNNNAMWNMLPFMLANKEQGKNIDPQVIQAMMMQSMLPNLDFNSGNNNKY